MKTNQLTFTPFTKKDIEIFHQINTNPFVRKYLWDDEIISLAISQEILAECENRFLNEKWGLWKIILTETQEVMGYVGFWYFFDESQPQLLYALLPEYAGKGYATEAANRIIAYAFEALQFDYVSASMDAANTKSVAVCEKLGMQKTEEKVLEGKPTIFFKKWKI